MRIVSLTKRRPTRKKSWKRRRWQRRANKEVPWQSQGQPKEKISQDEAKDAEAKRVSKPKPKANDNEDSKGSS